MLSAQQKNSHPAQSVATDSSSSAPNFDDPLLFDVTCHVYAAIGSAPISIDAFTAAFDAYCSDHEDQERSQVMLRLAMAAVHLYSSSSSSVATPRRGILSLLSRNATPTELADLPAMLDGASTAQLLEVLALVEQAFGSRADTFAGLADPFPAVLARSEVLQRENDELRRQLEQAVLQYGIKDLHRVNRELIEALYSALAVADASRKGMEAALGGQVPVGRTSRAVPREVQCELIGGGEVTASNRQQIGVSKEVRSLRKRIAKLEEMSSAAVRAAEERAAVAEARLAELQSQLLALQRQLRERQEPREAVNEPKAMCDVGTETEPRRDEHHEAAQQQWEIERKRLGDKLRVATHLLLHCARSSAPPTSPPTAAGLSGSTSGASRRGSFSVSSCRPSSQPGSMTPRGHR